MKRRDANAILIGLAAIGGGMAAYSVPVPLLEMAAVRSGIATTIPAAAPPLGTVARTIIIIASGMGACAFVAAVLPWTKTRDGGKIRGKIMTFAFSKLAFLSRGKSDKRAPVELIIDASDTLDIAPSVRKSDAHPDAPPRPPLMASRDLGEEALPPVEDASAAAAPFGEEPRGPIVTDITGLAMPRAPEPMPWEAIQSEMNRLLGGMRQRVEEDMDAAEDDSEKQALAAMAEPSIRDLTERLERGLARRRTAQAGAAHEEISEDPASPVSQDSPKEEPVHSAETELGDALAALRTITTRAG